MLEAFCWLTRATGAVLVPTLTVEAAQRYSTNRRWNPRWLWIALLTSGFAVLQTREVSFEQTFALPWAGIWKMVRAHYPTPNEADMVGVQELAFLALGLICTIISWIKLRPMYAAWMTGNLIVRECKLLPQHSALHADDVPHLPTLRFA